MVLLGVVMAIGFAIFNLPQVQRKMFYSGEGKFSEIGKDNEDFATTGRGAILDILLNDVSDSPWVGHGTGAAETLTYAVSLVGYPHNDWLLTYFDYSILGVVIYLLSNVLMMMHCIRSARQSNQSQTKLFFLAGASTFVPFMLVMFTDNIMVYASFFGMLQYLLIGLAYGALAAERDAIKALRLRSMSMPRR
jgi:O-antigen ligase